MPKTPASRVLIRVALGAWLAVGAAMAVGGAIAAGTPAATAVTIENFTFTPPTITIAAGTTVTWTNDDDIPHTVRAVDNAFHSKAMDTSDSYSFTFARPGVYSYFCSLHPKMVGKVVVK